MKEFHFRYKVFWKYIKMERCVVSAVKVKRYQYKLWEGTYWKYCICMCVLMFFVTYYFCVVRRKCSCCEFLARQISFFLGETSLSLHHSIIMLRIAALNWNACSIMHPRNILSSNTSLKCIQDLWSRPFALSSSCKYLDGMDFILCKIEK